MNVPNPSFPAPAPHDEVFGSAVVDRMRAADNLWPLPHGQLLLPRVFGLCRGVKRAMGMLEAAVDAHRQRGQKLFLLGQIIHNPWVNNYFLSRGVRLLSAPEMAQVERHIGPGDCAVIPAFGIPLPLEQRLARIGCEVIDTSCGDVRRLWQWATRAVQSGWGVLIFGRSNHDETVVTKSRLEAAGGKYVVVGSQREASRFCDLLSGGDSEGFARAFDAQATNTRGLDDFLRLAQVSQTTMLYDQTMEVRDLLQAAFRKRFGPDSLEQHLLFEPTVCRATQDRQTAAIQLCQGGCDLMVVVGGFGSSNTRHLYELARRHRPAFFIEGPEAIRSALELATQDFDSGEPLVVRDWLPERRPLRIGVLAGASSPEIVVGEVLSKLAQLIEQPEKGAR